MFGGAEGKKNREEGEKKPQGHAANDEENKIYKQQQQQVSALHIRALGALCRVLSQV